MYVDYIFHLDLCILAYQLYNQTLIFPLDPWYERLTRAGASRRDNFLAKTHEYLRSKANENPMALKKMELRGPGICKGLTSNNVSLDPILGKYTRLNPWAPAINRDASKYRLFDCSPTEITSKIDKFHVCEYTTDSTGDDVNLTRGNPTISAAKNKPGGGGTDVLYAFEGATGLTSTYGGAWSLMGYVLKCVLPGGYDVHIVFRGSQSGSGGRAAGQGLVAKGNPDWVTDMDNQHVEECNPFMHHGSICRGFKNAAKTFMPSVIACLKHIQTEAGTAPQNITVAGHSLGGALAACFTGAMVSGSWGAGVLPNWPWKNIKLFTYGCPAMAGDRYHLAFNSRVNAKRIWVHHDAITTAPNKYHVGAEVCLDGGYSATSLEAHEPAKIRECLLKLARDCGDDMTHVPMESPWRTYKKFSEALRTEHNFTTRVLPAMLSSFHHDIQLFSKIFQLIIPISSTYKTFITSGTSTERIALIRAAFEGAPIVPTGDLSGAIAAQNYAAQIAAKVTAVKDAQDDIANYLGLCVILNELSTLPNVPVPVFTALSALQATSDALDV